MYKKQLLRAFFATCLLIFISIILLVVGAYIPEQMVTVTDLCFGSMLFLLFASAIPATLTVFYSIRLIFFKVFGYPEIQPKKEQLHTEKKSGAETLRSFCSWTRRNFQRYRQNKMLLVNDLKNILVRLVSIIFRSFLYSTGIFILSLAANSISQSFGYCLIITPTVNEMSGQLPDDFVCTYTPIELSFLIFKVFFFTATFINTFNYLSGNTELQRQRAPETK